MSDDELEKTLVNDFRQLCPADKNTILTAVTVAKSVEDNHQRRLREGPACADDEQRSTKKEKSGTAVRGA